METYGRLGKLFLNSQLPVFYITNKTKAHFPTALYKHRLYPSTPKLPLYPKITPLPPVITRALLSLDSQVFYLGDLLGVAGARLQNLDLLVHVGWVQPAGALASLGTALLPQPGQGWANVQQIIQAILLHQPPIDGPVL